MKITCQQFEELIPFFINDELSDSLRESFIEHLHNCPNCHIKFNMLSSIVSDIKDAYQQLLFEPSKDTDIIDIEPEEPKRKNETNSELSAYIDNELHDEANIQIRRNIVARPFLRKKIEKLYNLRKLMTDSFNNEKNKLRTDFTKEVLKKVSQNPSQQETYIHCFLFITFVITTLIISIILLRNILYAS